MTDGNGKWSEGAIDPDGTRVHMCGLASKMHPAANPAAVAIPQYMWASVAQALKKVANKLKHLHDEEARTCPPTESARHDWLPLSLPLGALGFLVL